jgi:hypothetical protein
MHDNKVSNGPTLCLQGNMRGNMSQKQNGQLMKKIKHARAYSRLHTHIENERHAFFVHPSFVFRIGNSDQNKPPRRSLRSFSVPPHVVLHKILVIHHLSCVLRDQRLWNLNVFLILDVPQLFSDLLIQ